MVHSLTISLKQIIEINKKQYIVIWITYFISNHVTPSIPTEKKSSTKKYECIRCYNFSSYFPGVLL